MYSKTRLFAIRLRTNYATIRINEASGLTRFSIIRKFSTLNLFVRSFVRCNFAKAQLLSYSAIFEIRSNADAIHNIVRLEKSRNSTTLNSTRELRETCGINSPGDRVRVQHGFYSDQQASAKRQDRSSTFLKGLEPISVFKGDGKYNLRWLGIQPVLSIHSALQYDELCSFCSIFIPLSESLTSSDLRMIQITAIFVSPDFQMIRMT